MTSEVVQPLVLSLRTRLSQFMDNWYMHCRNGHSRTYGFTVLVHSIVSQTDDNELKEWYKRACNDTNDPRHNWLFRIEDMMDIKVEGTKFNKEEEVKAWIESINKFNTDLLQLTELYQTYEYCM